METRRIVIPRDSQHFLDNRLTDGGEVANPYMLATLHPQEDSWSSLLLEPQSTQDHSAAGMIRSIENPLNLFGNRTHNLPTSKIVCQPTTLLCVPILAVHNYIMTLLFQKYVSKLSVLIV
jgi:hypothetical protein